MGNVAAYKENNRATEHYQGQCIRFRYRDVGQLFIEALIKSIAQPI